MYQLTNLDQGIFNQERETNFDISVFEIIDGQINLTKMARHFGKEVKDWTRLEQSKNFITALSSVYPEEQIMHIKKGGNGKQGTFGNRQVALKLAQWISPEFEVFCIQKLDELFQTGGTQLTQPKKELSRLEILELALATEKENLKLQADLDYKNQIVIERAQSVPAERMRLTINRVVRNYAKKEGIWHQVVWSRLYEEFKYRFNIDLKARAKKGKSKIQIAEDLGKLEDLYNLALKMFEEEKIIVGVKI